MAVNIFYDTGGKTMQELLDFPLETDSPEVAQQKQARLMGNTPPAPPAEEAPPPQVVSKALTGRLRPEWKGNGK